MTRERSFHARHQPGLIGLGDLDDDGDPDISVVTSNGSQPVVRVLRNDFDPATGQAAFAPFGDQYAGTNPQLVTSADVNNDGATT